MSMPARAELGGVDGIFEIVYILAAHLVVILTSVLDPVLAIQDHFDLPSLSVKADKVQSGRADKSYLERGPAVA